MENAGDKERKAQNAGSAGDVGPAGSRNNSSVIEAPVPETVVAETVVSETKVPADSANGTTAEIPVIEPVSENEVPLVPTEGTKFDEPIIESVPDSLTSTLQSSMLQMQLQMQSMMEVIAGVQGRRAEPSNDSPEGSIAASLTPDDESGSGSVSFNATAMMSDATPNTRRMTRILMTETGPAVTVDPPMTAEPALRELLQPNRPGRTRTQPTRTVAELQRDRDLETAASAAAERRRSTYYSGSAPPIRTVNPDLETLLSEIPDYEQGVIPDNGRPLIRALELEGSLIPQRVPPATESMMKIVHSLARRAIIPMYHTTIGLVAFEKHNKLVNNEIRRIVELMTQILLRRQHLQGCHLPDLALMDEWALRCLSAGTNNFAFWLVCVKKAVKNTPGFEEMSKQLETDYPDMRLNFLDLYQHIYDESVKKQDNDDEHIRSVEKTTQRNPKHQLTSVRYIERTFTQLQVSMGGLTAARSKHMMVTYMPLTIARHARDSFRNVIWTNMNFGSDTAPVPDWSYGDVDAMMSFVMRLKEWMLRWARFDDLTIENTVIVSNQLKFMQVAKNGKPSKHQSSGGGGGSKHQSSGGGGGGGGGADESVKRGKHGKGKPTG